MKNVLLFILQLLTVQTVLTVHTVLTVLVCTYYSKEIIRRYSEAKDIAKISDKPLFSVEISRKDHSSFGLFHLWNSSHTCLSNLSVFCCICSVPICGASLCCVTTYVCTTSTHKYRMAGNFHGTKFSRILQWA